MGGNEGRENKVGTERTPTKEGGERPFRQTCEEGRKEGRKMGFGRMNCATMERGLPSRSYRPTRDERASKPTYDDDIYCSMIFFSLLDSALTSPFPRFFPSFSFGSIRRAERPSIRLRWDIPPPLSVNK